MATQPPAVSGDITSQKINDWHAYFESEKVGKSWVTFVNFEDYGAVGDGTADNTSAINALVTAFPNGAVVSVPAGTFYFADENSFPSKIQGFRFVGSVGAIFKFGAVCGTGTNSVPSAADIPNWISCSFEHIKFTAPNAAEYAIFSSGSRDLNFYKCVISDVKPHFLQGTDDRISLYKCKFEAPTTSAGTCLSSIGNVTQYFYVENCEWNFAPSQGGGTLISATNDSRLIGDYRFINNRFLTEDQAGFYIDSFIDLEPNNATTPLKNVIIKDNVSYNSKIYIGAVDNFMMKDNVMRFTVNDAGGPSGSPIQLTEAYATAPIGRVVIEDNSIICDDNTGYIYKQPIYVKETNTIDTLIFRNNKIVVNGAMVANANAMIIDASQATINFLQILGNEISYTSIPSTLVPIIQIFTDGSNTINIVEVEHNKVEGHGNSFFQSVSGSGVVSNHKRFWVRLNDLTAATLTELQKSSSNTYDELIIESNPGYEAFFQEITFENGWSNKGAANFGKAGYLKNSNGIVKLRGLVGGGTTGTAIFTIDDVNARPKNQVFCPVYTDDGGATIEMGRVIVWPDGRVNLQNGQTVSVSLESVIFSVS